jgi:hypothetical protein
MYRNDKDMKNLWDETMGQLAKLQGLIIIKKISQVKSTGDCQPLVKGLLSAVKQKMDAVNNILENNIQSDTVQVGGDSSEYYKEKYLKYKIKYFNLKNN